MSARPQLFQICDRCASIATDVDAHGNAYCGACAKHVAQLRRESQGLNTRRSELLEFLNEAHEWLNRAADLARDTPAWRDAVQTAQHAVTTAALDITEAKQ